MVFYGKFLDFKNPVHEFIYSPICVEHLLCASTILESADFAVSRGDKNPFLGWKLHSRMGTHKINKGNEGNIEYVSWGRKHERHRKQECGIGDVGVGCNIK